MIAPPDGFPDEALAVDVFIEQEQGQWVVYLDVIFMDETVRHRVQSYRTQRQAEIAGAWMKRGVNRNLDRPPRGV